MNKFIYSISILVSFLFFSLNFAQAQGLLEKLDASAFNEKILATSGAVILDVRTPQEFSKGHLKDAVNFNWNDENFSTKVGKMDKSAPVFVYCLSGGRSSAAANKIHEMGFKHVYEMTGGMMKWRAAKLPETAEVKSVDAGMSLAQFKDIIKADKLVLVDFYADWCAPCKKMKPYLDEISKDMTDKVKVVRVDIDANTQLSKELKIESLPVLHLYNKNKLVWNNKGYVPKEKVMKELRKNM